GLFAPGMLAMAFVGQLLTAWLRRGHVRKLGARFIKIVWPGDELTCHGRIAELRRETGACYADVELWAENQKGELVLRGQATCELYESPQNGGDRRGCTSVRGGSAPVVDLALSGSCRRGGSRGEDRPRRSGTALPRGGMRGDLGADAGIHSIDRKARRAHGRLRAGSAARARSRRSGSGPRARRPVRRVAGVCRGRAGRGTPAPAGGGGARAEGIAQSPGP